jgi:hypothetical protein
LKEALDTSQPLFLKGNALGGTCLEHQRKLAKAFVDFIGNDESGAILDMHLVPGAFSGKSEYTLPSLLADQNETASSKTMTQDGKKTWHAHPVRQKDMEERVGLPYKNGEFDWVFCNSVIEHAGDFAQQQLLLSELWRVARKGVFVTASNKRHPIEFNTGLPLLHWLPRNLWKTSLNWFGREEREADCLPNLLDAASLAQLAESVPDTQSYDIGHVRMAGIKAQFFLMIRKLDLQEKAAI